MIELNGLALVGILIIAFALGWLARSRVWRP